MSQVSATATTFLTEITDIVSRKTKCLLSALLYVAGSLSLTSTNVEFLLIGGILRGAGSSLLHSAFEVYLINEHAINGFPGEAEEVALGFSAWHHPTLADGSLALQMNG